jgi:NADPH:quinone reductase-like Zn-dependent oxidoreductase
VVGTGRATDEATVVGLGANEFLDLQRDRLEDVGQVDVVFDVIGGDVFERSLGVLRPGGRIVTLPGPPARQPEDGLALYFVVEPNRPQLADLARRLQDGRLRTVVGAVRPLEEAAAAFASGRHTPGKTIISVG